MNICFETFGCRLSRAEALEDEARCLAEGHTVVNRHDKADLIVLRGCSVTARAQRDCERMIAHLRRKYPNTHLVVLGCLPGAQPSLVIPFLRDASGVTGAPPVPTRTARAFLKVQDGCAGACTFCIVPRFRGKSVSEPFDATLAKAECFLAAGYREIVVTGCNLALYADAGKRLPDLVSALAGLSSDCRIRLGSIEPFGCADEIVDVMSRHENVCRFLHLPVQSGSDRILDLMNRPYREEDVERIVRKARSLMPDVALGCDLMAGFPGESEGDFVLTSRLLSGLGFVKAHVFPYSERPGTPATTLKGVIPMSLRAARARTLMEIARQNRQRFARRFVGREVDIVIESHSRQAQGWTGEYLWFEGPVRQTAEIHKTYRRKQLMRFVVRSADDGTLHGVPVKHGR